MEVLIQWFSKTFQNKINDSALSRLREIGVNTLMSPLMSAQYLEYLPFPFVMWAALRFQTWGAVTANFLLSLLAPWSPHRMTR